jgi:hypothetical protein
VGLVFDASLVSVVTLLGVVLFAAIAVALFAALEVMLDVVSCRQLTPQLWSQSALHFDSAKSFGAVLDVVVGAELVLGIVLCVALAVTLAMRLVVNA